MAKSAVIDLHNQIETIQREAYAAGYAAAMEAVLKFAARPESTKAPPRSSAKKPAAPPAATLKAPPAKREQATRGNNAALILDAIQRLPDQAGRAADIRKALSAAEVDLSYTSIRHSLGQLQGRGQVVLDADGKTWRVTE